jgi:hypothetical protein
LRQRRFLDSGRCDIRQRFIFFRRGGGRRHAVGFCCFLGALSKFLFGLLRSAKIEQFARRFPARGKVDVEAPGIRPIEIGKDRAARICDNPVDRIARRTESEPVQGERRSGFSRSCIAACGHQILPRDGQSVSGK